MAPHNNISRSPATAMKLTKALQHLLSRSPWQCRLLEPRIRVHTILGMEM